MTPAQRTLYFRLWSQALAALKREPGEGEVGVLVSRFAARLAQAQARPVTNEDLRHGAHCVAFGHDKSSKDLTNAELDRLFALFRLLADPDDLDARLTWDFPERAQVKRLDWFIAHAAPEAYTRAISADRFGTKAWENLAEAQKRQLAVTLSNRRPPGQEERRAQSEELPSPLSPLPSPL